MALLRKLYSMERIIRNNARQVLAFYRYCLGDIEIKLRQLFVN